jgi:hypothetical protein
MLITLLLWGYITVICLLAGDAVCRLFRLEKGLPLPAVALLGWAGLTNVLGYLWLAVPVGLVVHALIVGGLLVFGWLRRDYWRERLRAVPAHPTSFWLTSLLCVAVILTRTTHLPRLLDTGGYHAPMIRWISEYAVIPGLANVNYRFGFNNASFLTEAFFSLRFLGGPSFHVLNGWLMLVVALWSLDALSASGKLSNRYVFGMGVLFLWHAHWRLSSPTPDHPAQLLVGLVFYLLIRRMEGARGEVLPVVWLTLLAFTIKMSTLVLLAIPLAYFGEALFRKNYRLAGGIVAAGLFPLAWWLAANVVLTGYILYPTDAAALDWFPVDWKVPAVTIQQGLKNLSGGTKLSPVKGLLDFSWVPHWSVTQPVPDKVIFLLLFGWPLVGAAGWKTVRAFARTYPLWPWLVAIAYGGVAFWFINAPELRFGMGFIIAALLLGYLPFVKLRYIQLLHLGLAFFFVTLLYASFTRQRPAWVFPEDYPAAKVRSYRLSGYTIYFATDDPKITHGIYGYWGNCQDMALPCCPYYNPGLVLRGDGMGEGFRVRR